MAGSEKSPPVPTPAAEGEPKASSLMALVLPLLIVTVLAAGTGAVIGLMLPQHNNEVQTAQTGHGQTSHDKDSGRRAAGASLKALPPITTNLVDQKSTWVRLEAAIVLEGEPPADIDVLGGKVADDIMAFLRTVQLAQIEGPSGLQNLREDLNDLVRIRSAGKVRELVLQSLIVE
ncbi:MAG TPA: flagellar basal body-associated FliL family protein [Hyphomicrobiaceae bacterium]|nr:flagellar basal body-associated FliL family protein [Hyphomicrobiaceae bacterium]